MDKLSYRCHRFPSIVIQQAVWLYFRFALSYRDVEDMLAERGIDVSFSKHAIFAGATVRLLLTAIAISRSPGARNYLDQALTPVGDDGDETLDLFTKTTGGGAAVAHIKKIARLIGAPRAA